MTSMKNLRRAFQSDATSASHDRSPRQKNRRPHGRSRLRAQGLARLRRGRRQGAARARRGRDRGRCRRRRISPCPPGTEIAFNVIHGTFGEDGQIQRILEARGVPYTGEGVAGSELAIDKIATKQRFSERGVPTPAFEILRDGAPPTLPLPFVMKAPREGSSVGVYIVQRRGEGRGDAARGARTSAASCSSSNSSPGAS